MTTTLRNATDYIISTIRSEFDEMPGMKLTREQICRLWHLEHHEAEHVIRLLMTSGFLRRDAQNRYGRALDAGT